MILAAKVSITAPHTVACICAQGLGQIATDLGDTHPHSHKSTSHTAHPEAELIQCHPLNQFNLAFIPDIWVLIYTLCQVGLPLKEWRGHLDNQHKEVFDHLWKGFKNDIHQLPAVISSLDLGDPNVVREWQAGQAPVRGIRIENRLYCPLKAGGSPCHEVVGTMSSFATHLSKVHKDTSWKPSGQERRTYIYECQTIFQGVHQRYFQVFMGLLLGSASKPHKAPLHQSKQPVLHTEQHQEKTTFNICIKLCQKWTFDVFLWKIMENIQK